MSKETCINQNKPVEINQKETHELDTQQRDQLRIQTKDKSQKKSVSTQKNLWKSKTHGIKPKTYQNSLLTIQKHVQRDLFKSREEYKSNKILLINKSKETGVNKTRREDIEMYPYSVAVCCSVLQCVAVCCSVLQCVAVCCSVNKTRREDIKMYRQDTSL